MQIELPSDATQFLNHLVSSGQLASPDEALLEGVRLLMSTQKLKDEIQQGVNELDTGKGIAGEDVFSELEQRAKSRCRCI